jgi:CheY-like chemotaxis protein
VGGWASRGICTGRTAPTTRSRAISGAEALSVLAAYALRHLAVALIAADQRMPEMTGMELLLLAWPHGAAPPEHG